MDRREFLQASTLAAAVTPPSSPPWSLLMLERQKRCAAAKSLVCVALIGNPNTGKSTLFSALAGVRQDWVHAASLDTRATTPFASEDETALSPRFGLIYQLVPSAVAVYGAYGQSFQPVVGRSRLGDPFDPERGNSWEAGFKFDLLDEQLAVIAAHRLDAAAIAVNGV